MVIIGGGVSGMATGIMLSEIDGLSVTLLEAQPELGGVFRTSYTSPATYYPANRSEMAVLDDLIGDPSTVDDFYSDLKDALQFLEAKGVISNKYLMGFDNYEVREGEEIQNTYGLDLLDAWKKMLVTYGMQMIFPTDFYYHARYRMKAISNMIEISDQLRTEFEKSQVDVHYNSKVLEVYDDRVVTDDGTVFSYDYLVFASGGLGSNTALQKEIYGIEFNPHEFNTINTGIALETSIEKQWNYNKELFAWYAEVVELNDGGFSAVLFQPGPGVLTVNRNGKRVYNEKQCYNKRGKVTLEEKELLLITDEDNIENNTPHFPYSELFMPNKYSAYLPTLNEGKYIHASSIEELGQIVRGQGILGNISANFEQELVEQWTRYLEFVDSGVDWEFQRGNDYGEVLDGGDPSLPPASELKNKAMAPINENKLIAVRLLPSSLDTCSGPTVDRSARVQKLSQVGNTKTFEPVKNIFAVGNAAEAILGGHYNAPGIPIASGFVGAYRVYTTLLENHTQHEHT